MLIFGNLQHLSLVTIKSGLRIKRISDRETRTLVILRLNGNVIHNPVGTAHGVINPYRFHPLTPQAISKSIRVFGRKAVPTHGVKLTNLALFQGPRDFRRHEKSRGATISIHGALTFTGFSRLRQDSPA